MAELNKPHSVIVHEFRMGDVEDPDLYAAQPLWDWQQSEIGQWVMEHAIETPSWHRTLDISSFGHAYRIVAEFNSRDYTYWAMKWGCLTK